MTRRIPPAECTEHPWWGIIDPARLRLPHPADIPAHEDAPDEDSGTKPDPDYRDGIQAEQVYGAITGPFFSREAADTYVDARRREFSDRTQVWCMPGGSAAWRALCREEVP